MMNYRIETKPELVLTGYRPPASPVCPSAPTVSGRRRISSAPPARRNGCCAARLSPTTSTTAWSTNLNDDGYDFFIAVPLDVDECAYMLDPAVMGVDMAQFGFEHITIPPQTYAVFATERSKMPVDEYIDIRQSIATEWLPGSGYTLADALELALYHWRPQAGRMTAISKSGCPSNLEKNKSCPFIQDSSPNKLILFSDAEVFAGGGAWRRAPFSKGVLLHGLYIIFCSSRERKSSEMHHSPASATSV